MDGRRCIALLLSFAPVAAWAQASDYARGVALFESGHSREAIPYLRKAVIEDPSNAQRWKALGVAYAAMGDYANSEEPFRNACDLDRKLKDACYYYARTLYALNRFEPAIEVLSRARETEPDSWRIRLAMAEALEALERPAEAEREFRSALALSGQADAKAANGYALFLIRQGRAKDALPVLWEAMNRFPRSFETRVRLGWALAETGRCTDAVAHLERAVALDPGSAQAHLLLGKCYVRLGRGAEAQPHFEAAHSMPSAAREP